MDDIEFDEGAARRLIAVADAGDDRLRAQGGTRAAAAEDALWNFEGAYSQRFVTAVQVEAADRAALARQLAALADQVRAAVSQATKERKRLADLAAWTSRERHRQEAAATDPLRAFGISPTTFPDPRPSTSPIMPSEVSASFTPRQRERTGSGTSGGRSSAYRRTYDGSHRRPVRRTGQHHRLPPTSVEPGTPSSGLVGGCGSAA